MPVFMYRELICGRIVKSRMDGILQKILKLNPLFYIVQGYRDSLIGKVAIWEHPVLTLYFWVFTAAVFIFGTRLFKKLQVHFADVL